MKAATLQELSVIALEVAEQAAALVHGGFARGVRAREKGRADLVTEFDLASEELIRTALAKRTPELAMVGEEAGGEARGPTWYCDPIDGTTNFVQGHPFFCVSIGLMDGATPLLGAIVAPALGLRYAGFCAQDGERNALRNGAPCAVSSTDRLRDAFLATGFHPRALEQELEDNLVCFGRALRQVRGVRRCGSAALDLAMVADGTYDAYWERSLNAWDTAAGAALVLAAGGRLTDLAGGPAQPARGHILASNGLLHEAMLTLLDESEKRR